MSKAEAKQTNEVAVRATTELAVPEDVASASWGAVEGLETTDLLVPKIFHQQAMSKLVADGKAKPGDFCDSLTGDVLAGKESKLEVIIFGSYKTMVISKYDAFSKKFKLDRIVTITPENAKEWATVPFEEVVDGVDVKNSLQYNYYVLIPGKVNEIPYVLSLGSTKTRAAKKLNTMLYKLSQLKRNGASVVFELHNVVEKNDQGSWFGLEIKQGRNATPEELMRAYAWHVKSKSSSFKVVEEESASSTESDDDHVPF